VISSTRNKLSRVWAPALILLVALPILTSVVLDQEAWGRVGGGHSYSGGSSSRGGSSSHGSSSSRGGYSSGSRSYSNGSSYSGSGGEVDLEVIFWILRVCFKHPKIGVPFLLILAAVIIHQSRSNQNSKPRPAARQAQVHLNPLLNRYRQRNDPNFSKTAFLDFAARLFAEVHDARGRGKVGDYSLFLNEHASDRLHYRGNQLTSVAGIALGSVRIVSLQTRMQGESPDTTDRITVAFEACMTETDRNKKPRTLYTQEEWTFERKTGVFSLEPEKLRHIRCPACGAAPQASRGICGSCGKSINTGRFNWVVTVINDKSHDRPPLLTQHVEEQGTDLPTLVDPDFRTNSQALKSELSEFSWDIFRKRATHIFVEMQRGWKARDLKRMRPFETDNLFSAHTYWIEEYRRQKLINNLDQLKIIAFDPVKIEIDRFNFAITARIHASMIDTTQWESGEHLFGSRKKPREFTEYWTFIRSRGAPGSKKGGDAQCPSCGAELKISQAGNCEYCGSHIVSGEYDWVASLIEQDEAYHG
jgi:predicted lipid-binding transport protein (Tim44 family)